MVDVDQLIALQRQFDATHKGRFDWDAPINEASVDVLQYLLVATMGELGEVANIAKKVARGDMSFEVAKPSLSEELIDVLTYVLKIGYQMGVDIEGEYRKKLARNVERFRQYEGKTEGRGTPTVG